MSIGRGEGNRAISGSGLGVQRAVIAQTVVEQGDGAIAAGPDGGNGDVIQVQIAVVVSYGNVIGPALGPDGSGIVERAVNRVNAAGATGCRNTLSGANRVRSIVIAVAGRPGAVSNNQGTGVENRYIRTRLSGKIDITAFQMEALERVSRLTAPWVD